MKNKKINMREMWNRLRIILFVICFSAMLPACSSEGSANNSDKETLIEDVQSDDGAIPDELLAAEDRVQAGIMAANGSVSQSDNEEISVLSGTITIPAYSGKPYVLVNNNQPFFLEEDLTSDSYETYADLDEKERCGICVASIGSDLMPTEDRGSIGAVKPTGWHTVKYDNVDGKYLYNRCHLIGYQLTAENANKKNLITGTRYLNVNGMLPFENLVADYIKETNNHVLYRVTPVFEKDNLLASGVLIEGMSVEDDGEGILFNVFCYNVQPGIKIDYATGSSEVGNADYESMTIAINSSGLVEGAQTAAPTQTGTTAPTAAPTQTGTTAPTAAPTQAETTAPTVAETKAPTVAQTVATTQSQASNNNADSIMVWIPKTGSKYHSKASCSSMKNPSQVTKSKAESMGYTPCSKCW
ncbi:MAG: DNA/RNA non-specific endonuclease [Lachnospira sp.]